MFDVSENEKLPVKLLAVSLVAVVVRVYFDPLVVEETLVIVSGRLAVSVCVALVVVWPVTSLPEKVVLSLLVSVSLALTDSAGLPPVTPPVFVSVDQSVALLLSLEEPLREPVISLP